MLIISEQRSTDMAWDREEVLNKMRASDISAKRVRELQYAEWKTWGECQHGLNKLATHRWSVSKGNMWIFEGKVVMT